MPPVGRAGFRTLLGALKKQQKGKWQKKSKEQRRKR